MAIFLVNNPDKQKIVLIFMRFFPQISFAYSLIWLGITNALEGVDGGDDDDGAFESFDPFIEPIRTSLIYMACEAVGYTVIVLLLERLVAYVSGSRHLVSIGSLCRCTGLYVRTSQAKRIWCFG